MLPADCENHAPGASWESPAQTTDVQAAMCSLLSRSARLGHGADRRQEPIRTMDIRESRHRVGGLQSRAERRVWRGLIRYFSNRRSASRRLPSRLREREPERQQPVHDVLLTFADPNRPQPDCAD